MNIIEKMIANISTTFITNTTKNITNLFNCPF